MQLTEAEYNALLEVLVVGGVNRQSIRDTPYSTLYIHNFITHTGRTHSWQLVITDKGRAYLEQQKAD